jgi:uncharacterized protein
MNNQQVVEQFYGHLGRGEREAAFALLHDNFVLHQAASLPYGGDFVGRTGVEHFFRLLSETWGEFGSRDVAYVEVGDRVIATSQMYGTLRSTMTKIEMPMVQVYRVHDGKLVETHPFYWDTALIAAAGRSDHTT